MDSDRKYRQPGYMDSDRDSRGYREDRPKPQGPRPPIDVTGPRLPRLSVSPRGERNTGQTELRPYAWFVT